MSSRSPVTSSRRTQRTPPRAHKQDSDARDDGSPAPSAEDASLNPMVGRRVLKPLGDTVCSGWVQEHKSASAGKEELWVIHWDDDGEEDEEVNRSVLDKRLNLQSVKEREFPPQGSSKKAKTRSKSIGSASKNSQQRSSTKRGRSASSKVATSSPKSSKKKKRASAVNGSGKSTPKKKNNGSSSGKGKGGDVSTELQEDKSDVGTLVAKVFSEGVFTGEVVKVKMQQPTLWAIRYEDGDAEELDKKELLGCMELYQVLLEKFEAARGRAVTSDDEAQEKSGGDADNNEEEEDGSAKRDKGKGKAKAKEASNGGGGASESEQEKILGSRVRKKFEQYDEEYDGKVSKYFAEESDDDHGDLWLIKYDDGDAEHMDLKEVSAAMALYEKHYALQRKEVEYSANASVDGKSANDSSAKTTKAVLFAEKPDGSRLFAKIKHYRDHKNAGS